MRASTRQKAPPKRLDEEQSMPASVSRQKPKKKAAKEASTKAIAPKPRLPPPKKTFQLPPGLTEGTIGRVFAC